MLQPLLIPKQHWEKVSMDFITSLPNYEGNSAIMVVVDRLTNYAYTCALSHHFKVNIVATTFMETIQKLHENPNIIVSEIDHICFYSETLLQRSGPYSIHHFVITIVISSHLLDCSMNFLCTRFYDGSRNVGTSIHWREMANVSFEFLKHSTKF